MCEVRCVRALADEDGAAHDIVLWCQLHAGHDGPHTFTVEWDDE